MVLNTKIQEVLERNEFEFDEEVSEQGGIKYIEINQSTPEGEDWRETIWFGGTYSGFVDAVAERVSNFDIAEEAEIFITNRGKGGCPDNIINIVRDAAWKKKTLERLLDDLRKNEKETESEITEESVENKLYDFFYHHFQIDDEPEIEAVGRLQEVFATRDNGVVIDCASGKQIRLIIQVY